MRRGVLGLGFWLVLLFLNVSHGLFGGELGQAYVLHLCAVAFPDGCLYCVQRKDRKKKMNRSMFSRNTFA